MTSYRDDLDGVLSAAIATAGSPASQLEQWARSYAEFCCRYGGRRRASECLTDFLPPQPLLVAERSRCGGAFERALAMAARCLHREQGVELRLIEEADLHVVVRDRRGLVHELSSAARRRRPPELSQAQESVWQLKEKLARHASTDEQQAYVAALERLFTERRGTHAEAAARSEQATQDAVEELAHITLPPSVVGEHEAVRAAFQAHLDAARRFHEASAAAVPDRVLEATAGWEASVRSGPRCGSSS